MTDNTVKTGSELLKAMRDAEEGSTLAFMLSGACFLLIILAVIFKTAQLLDWSIVFWMFFYAWCGYRIVEYRSPTWAWISMLGYVGIFINLMFILIGYQEQPNQPWWTGWLFLLSLLGLKKAWIGIGGCHEVRALRKRALKKEAMAAQATTQAQTVS